MKIVQSAAVVALALAGPAQAAWTPRQEAIIRAANATVMDGMWAYTNSCKILDGKARYAAGLNRLKAMTPAMEKELGEYAVHEIFVLRAPVYAPGAHPPARCKRLKSYRADREALMRRYEQALDALETALKPE